jgi:ZIP family zinc transporter
MKERTLHNAIAAGVWGLVSASSLVLGALVGVSFPVSEKVNGLIMAFGAGALFFAVAIEMFAAGIRELEEGKDSSSMNILISASVVGAIFYTLMNRCLTGGSGGHHEESGNAKTGEYDRVEGIEGDAKPNDENGEVAHQTPDKSGVAISIWLGILIDGVPESMLIGFMQSEGELSVAFIVAVFVANFPEAMSASSLMYKGGDSLCKIMCMWNVLFVGTGLIAFLTSLVFPGHCKTKDERTICEFPSHVNFIASASEGLAGGAMMACISTAMLPEAYESGGDFAGLCTLLGFLTALFVKLNFERKGEAGAVCSHECMAGSQAEAWSSIHNHHF